MCFLSRGVCEFGGPGPRWLYNHPSGRSAAALWCCPAGWGVSGEWEHAHRWSSKPPGRVQLQRCVIFYNLNSMIICLIPRPMTHPQTSLGFLNIITLMLRCSSFQAFEKHFKLGQVATLRLIGVTNWSSKVIFLRWLQTGASSSLCMWGFKPVSKIGTWISSDILYINLPN